LGEIVDPPNVEDQPDKWGFVTRLEHLNDIVEDGNSPFELYKKEDHEQFNHEIKEVTVDGEMPEGIGVWEEVIDETAQTAPGTYRGGGAATRNWILIDPMTGETISKETVLDEEGKPKLYRGQQVYKVNDHWFVLNAKFLWKDAPEPPKQPVTSQYGIMSPQRPTTTTTTTSPSSSSSSSKRSKLPDLDM
jgi:hypothetical protein